MQKCQNIKLSSDIFHPQAALHNSTETMNGKDSSWMSSFSLKAGGKSATLQASHKASVGENVGGDTPPVAGSPKVEKRESQGINLLPDVVSILY